MFKIFKALRNVCCYYKIKFFYRSIDLKKTKSLDGFKLRRSSKWFRSLSYLKINKQLGKNSDSTLPVSPLNHVLYFKNLFFDPSDYRILQGSGKYFQCVGKICIGKGTYIANNVGLITSNHVFSDLSKHQIPKDIHIGNNCWIGINATILPGVTLGDSTIVGAGSVVTKSFPDGHVIIAGNPAKIIKNN